MEITIPRRFCGPPNSGNGGYSAGRLAVLIDGAAEITLRAPPPLDTAMRIERGEGPDGGIKLFHGESCVGEARAAPAFTMEVPAPPSWDEALAAAMRYNGLRHHAYDNCFVCGPARAVHDGLRIFCGPWKGGQVAGTWTPDATLADSAGRIAPEFLWAAIDCPGSWSVIGRDDVDAPIRAVPSSLLLGRLTGRIDRSLRAGDDCTVLGWFLGAEGRKYHVGTAVHTRAGELVACSRATWVIPKSAEPAKPA